MFPNYLLSISESKFRRTGLPNRGVRFQNIAKNVFSRKSFCNDFVMAFCRFSAALGTVFSNFLGLGNRFGKRGIFVMQLDPETGFFHRFEPSKNIQA